MTEIVTRESITRYLSEVKRLSDHDLNESAILLASFVVSLTDDCNAKAHARFALGNALRADGQLVRALKSYQDALHEVSRVPSTTPVQWSLPGEVDESFFAECDAENEDDSMTIENDGIRRDLTEKKRHCKSTSPVPPSVAQTAFASKIRFRIAQCHSALGNDEAAVSTLESCSKDSMTGPALAFLGRLKRRSRSKGTASVLLQALEKEPMALELISALLDLEIDSEEVLRVLNLKGRRKLAPWIEALVRTHGLSSSHRVREAVTRYAQLGATVLPGNSHVLTSLAQAEMESGRIEAAVHWFDRARAIDPHALEGAGELAFLLKAQGDRPKLVQLTHELFGSRVTSKRSEPWIAAAHLSDLQGDTERALVYTKRALDVDPVSRGALHLKGSLLLRIRRPLEALACYAHALQARRDFAGLEGLVESYLTLSPSKWSDALQVAKEAVALMPNDPRVFLLMARALSANEQKTTVRLAVEAVMRASRLDPNNTAACSMMADLRMIQFKSGDCDKSNLLEAAQMLRRLLQVSKSVRRDGLHLKIGTIYSVAGDRSQALENFHDALSINPINDDARKALESLEGSSSNTSARTPRMAQHQHVSQQSSAAARGHRSGAWRSSRSPTDASPPVRRRLAVTGDS